MLLGKENKREQYRDEFQLQFSIVGEDGRLPIMPEPHDVPDEAPPFLGTWKRVYTAVLIYLVGIISVFYVFTRAYR